MKTMRVIGHSRRNPCPACKKPKFCDDCGLCENEKCSYSLPDIPQPGDGDIPHVETCKALTQEASPQPQIAWPKPRVGDHYVITSLPVYCTCPWVPCPECGGNVNHLRTCSITLADAAASTAN